MWIASRQSGSPTGDEAAARAMVARKDLSPHSAAKTRVNVESSNPAAPEQQGAL